MTLSACFNRDSGNIIMETKCSLQALRGKTGDRSRPSVKSCIWIVGANSLQNSLLGTHIEVETGIECVSFAEMKAPPRDRECLVMYDCFSTDDSRLWIRVESLFMKLEENASLALFNINPDSGVERDAVSRGIRGVFYRNQSPEVLARGVDAILRGELWYSRKTTSRMLLETSRHARTSQMVSVGLTPREKEILLVIAAGASNSDISDKFHISPHTVKNHVYNIYRKIEVKSRLEAILWVTKYL